MLLKRSEIALARMNRRDHQPVIDEIVHVIANNDDFLVLTHVNPDGDAVGSVVALGRVLVALGKSCHLLSPGDIPPEHLFLSAPGEISPVLPTRKSWQVIFLIDTPCASRLPLSLSGEIPPCNELINIDHHASNDIAAASRQATKRTLNWVNPSASSVGEMLYHLFATAGYVISPDVASPLYAAILTDTGSFRFPNTTSSALTAAAELVERGADPANLADKIYFSHSVGKFRLLAEALPTLQVCCSGKAAFMWVTAQMLRKAGAPLVETDGFENFPRTVKGVEVAILFKQTGDGQTVKVSLRSKRETVDVSRVAAQFGGGGHPTAAGCVITGSMTSVQERVVEAIAGELARVPPQGGIAGASPASEAICRE